MHPLSWVPWVRWALEDIRRNPELLPALVYSNPWTAPDSSLRSNDRGILEGFLKLAEASPDTIVRYAKRNGVLLLCHHGYPASHNPGQEPVAHHPEGVDLSRVDHCGPCFIEPLKHWRTYSSKAKTLLSIASQIHRDIRPEDKLWGVLGRDRPGEKFSEAELLAAKINYWIRIGGVCPQLEWDQANRARVEVQGYGLFGALARQLLFAISRIKALAFCSGCGLPFQPTRRPVENQRSWCPECKRRKVDRCQAEADYRARQLGKNVGKHRSSK